MSYIGRLTLNPAEVCGSNNVSPIMYPPGRHLRHPLDGGLVRIVRGCKRDDDLTLLQNGISHELGRYSLSELNSDSSIVAVLVHVHKEGHS